MIILSMGERDHWADETADRIIREKGNRDSYVCAAGITPSGVVHIGNFREIITVDLVVRALRQMGKKVRFIYSWDDYDVFRKVPKNMPKADVLEKYLRMPITSVPDTRTEEKSYARANEVRVEKALPKVGIFPEFIYQADRYKSGVYAFEIRKALEHRDGIRAILDEYRTEALPDSWQPVSVFSSFTGKDGTEVTGWDGEWCITYTDKEAGKSETIDLRNTPNTKLPWRIDWPMRWSYEKVDFEPGGKDHLTDGGSYDTSKEIVKIFGGNAPVSLKYDFVRLKGMGGKMSSSGGDLVDLEDVLEVYTPEIVRYMFAGTRPSAEFAVSFDLDVLKMYEDYDNTERIYFGITPVSEKKFRKEKRIYELSQVDPDNIPKEPGYQVPFRHLCNYLQVYSGDIEKVLLRMPDATDSQKERLRARLRAAWNWIENYAPEEFKFSLSDASVTEVTGTERSAIREMLSYVRDYMDELSERDFSTYIYKTAEDNGMSSSDFFSLMYRVLIGKEKGPKLSSFLKACGTETIIEILGRY